MAAELKGLREEVDRLRHDIERHVEIACELATECESLRAELAEIRALWKSKRGDATAVHLALHCYFDAARKGEGE